jgi:hypothetical protein
MEACRILTRFRLIGGFFHIAKNLPVEKIGQEIVLDSGNF